MILKYKCLRTNIFFNNNFSLEVIQKKEIEEIRIWRNLNIDVLRQKKIINKKQQYNYFKNNIWSDLDKKKPKNILFSFKKNSKLIGYGGFVHISWENNRSEISFLLSDSKNINKDYIKKFNYFLKIIEDIAFAHLNFNKIYTETFIDRKKHIKILEKFGFKKEGLLKKQYFFKNRFIDTVLHGYIK